MSLLYSQLFMLSTEVRVLYTHSTMSTAPYVVWFADVDLHATSSIGKHGKHYGGLVQAGFPLLPGFVITPQAYFAFLKQNKLEDKIKKLLTTVNYDRPESMHQVMHHIKSHVKNTQPPEAVVKELLTFYDRLEGYPLIMHAYTHSSHTHKFASQKAASFEELLDGVIASWVEHFEPNVHWKRHEKNLDHLETGVEIIVQVDLEPPFQGKIHTDGQYEHIKNVITITHEHPHAKDSYTLSKKTLMVLDRHLTYHGTPPKLDLETLLELARLGKALEEHFYFPQDITWGIFGETIYVLHTKPLQIIPNVKQEKKKKLAHTRGHALTPLISSGYIHIIDTDTELSKVSVHDIVVIDEVKKHQINHLKKARGIISEKGQRHSEVSTLLKMHGIPALYGVQNAKKRFKNGTVITIHGGKGEIYIGGHH
jgi:pyruvate, water dikinase